MQQSLTFGSARRYRGLAIGATGLMLAGLAIGVPNQPADAAGRCGSSVTNLNLLSKQRFAGDSVLRRYKATVDYPGATGWVDQTANALYTVLPGSATPTLLNSKIGDRATTGSMVSGQQPSALAAINGDFFVTPTIRGREVELSRGPMVRDGRILRADRQRGKVVGVDVSGAPFGGEVGVRGQIRPDGGQAIDLAAVNWHKIQSGGVTLYTSNWSSLSSSPRPAGDAEWVLNGRNKIVEIRSATKNTASLGKAVDSGTRVIAFPSTYALVAISAAVGDRVAVKTRQSTSTGVRLMTAVGRGVNLVAAGVAAPLGCDAYDHSKAARPRTVIGWTKTGAWRAMTVPGTHFDGVGLRLGGFGLSNEAALAKKLGMYYAYEVDGGGSTTLYTRSKAGKWTRRDLFGVTGGTYERAVTNGVAFLNTAP
ncbi:MAG TPA: phosphodiester glycosidase family protein [Actinomycetes bacterium]|nr:phosphodiester glycosidase family protein [Actinomycetes bacterium]